MATITKQKTLGTLGVKALSGRSIDPEVAARLGVFTGRESNGEVIPDENGSVMCFPFMEDGVEVATKFRAAGKRFWQRVGGKRTFYNADALDDPSLYDGSNPLVITEGECFPASAEVLTEKGWVRFDAYAGDPVLQVSPDGTGQFVEPLAFVNKAYVGPLVRYQGQDWVSETTPGHMLPGIDIKGRWRKFEAKGGPVCATDLIPTSTLVNGPGIGLSKDQIAFSLAVSADATIEVRKRANEKWVESHPYLENRYARISFKKDRKIERFRSLCERLDISFSETVQPSNPEFTFFGMHVPDWVPGRILPMEWVARATLEEREFLLSEMRHWDGNTVKGRDQDEYATIHPENAAFAQAIAHTSGRCSTIMTRSNEFGVWLKVSILHGKHHRSWQGWRRKISHSFYAGHVYCVQVPSGFLLVRQEGKVMVSGNCDCLSAITCGFPLSVSVPDGAPSPPKEKKEEGETDDSSGKFEFLYVNRDRLKKIKRFIIAVDNDAPGKYLAEELVRRLSAARCSFVTYPEGCKDLNDVLMKHGQEAAYNVLANAKPYPLKGVYSLSDYPDRPPIQTFSTGWATVDAHYKPFAPSLTVLLGLPGSGKSTWLMNLCVNLADLHGWKAAIFTPEMPIVPNMRDVLRCIVSGEDVERLTPKQIAKADQWINQHFVFIDFDVAGDDDQDLTLEWFLDRAYDALMRYGIRVLVLDPWNEVEHAKSMRESTTEYTNRAIRKLIKFGRRHGMASFIVVHPTKDVAQGGKTRIPTLYDADGSAAWYNKPDFGIIVDRDPNKHDKTDIYIKKVRFRGTGEKGHIVMKFNRDNSRFELLSADPYQQEMT